MMASAAFDDGVATSGDGTHLSMSARRSSLRPTQFSLFPKTVDLIPVARVTLADETKASAF